MPHLKLTSHQGAIKSESTHTSRYLYLSLSLFCLRHQWMEKEKNLKYDSSQVSEENTRRRVNCVSFHFVFVSLLFQLVLSLDQHTGTSVSSFVRLLPAWSLSLSLPLSLCITLLRCVDPPLTHLCVFFPPSPFRFCTSWGWREFGFGDPAGFVLRGHPHHHPFPHLCCVVRHTHTHTHKSHICRPKLCVLWDFYFNFF